MFVPSINHSDGGGEGGGVEDKGDKRVGLTVEIKVKEVTIVEHHPTELLGRTNQGNVNWKLQNDV